MMLALQVTADALALSHRERTLDTGQGMQNILSIVQMVKHSHPFSCPFSANKMTRFAIVGRMMAEAPSPDRPMKNSHAMTGSRRPGTVRKGRASAMQWSAWRKPRILTRRAPRKTKIKVRAKLMIMSYDRRGIVIMRGSPMRHLPSIWEREVTGFIKAKTARTPKPKRTIAIPRR